LTFCPADLIQSELKMKLLEVEGGHMPQCPMAGDATDDRQQHKCSYRIYDTNKTFTMK